MAGGSSERLLIVGTGGLGRETLWLAREAGVEVAGFLDDSAAGDVDGVPVVGPLEDRTRHDAALIVAIGAPRIRRSVVARIERSGAARFATLIHPSVRRSHNVAVGAGSIVAAGAVLSCDVALGAHVVVGIGAIVSHDCRLANFVTIAPGVTIPGKVVASAGCEIALNATLRQGTVLGKGAMVGMGAVVPRDVEEDMLVYGVPARPIRPLPSFETSDER